MDRASSLCDSEGRQGQPFYKALGVTASAPALRAEELAKHVSLEPASTASSQDGAVQGPPSALIIPWDAVRDIRLVQRRPRSTAWTPMLSRGCGCASSLTKIRWTGCRPKTYARTH